MSESNRPAERSLPSNERHTLDLPAPLAPETISSGSCANLLRLTIAHQLLLQLWLRAWVVLSQILPIFHRWNLSIEPHRFIFRQVDRWGNLRPPRQSAVALVVKSAAETAGLDPRPFAGHSLRSGFITAAHLAGASERDMAEVLRGCIHAAGLGARRAVTQALGE